MHSQRFFDQALRLIEQDHIEAAIGLVVGKLHVAVHDSEIWRDVRECYRAHPLRDCLMQDPYVARCVEKPRGYAGDAVLIDMAYDRVPPAGTSPVGARAFAYSTAFPASQAVALRREYAAGRLEAAIAAGQRVLCLASGHFREGDRLSAADLGQVVVVDQDAASLEVVKARFGSEIEVQCANAFSFLRGAVSSGRQFDFVYTLGLTDYLDDRAMQLLHKLSRRLLEPGGTFLLANFLPHHLAVGWMDAVMEWDLIYREPEVLEAYAVANQFTAKTWIDPTGSIAWCEMHAI